MIEKSLQNKISLFGKFGVLPVLIVVGTIFRFCYPFFSHPVDHFFSDPYRHYLNATVCFNKAIFSWLDPPFPQFWLRAILFLFTNTRLGVSVYFGLLSAAMPWCWYLWGQQIFSSKKKQLIYLTAITFLPSWIGIYGYFMDETLLLPALGLTLWLSWKARQLNTAKCLLLAILAWAITLSIKLNVLFELIIIVPWLFFHFLKHNGYKLRSYAILLASTLILTMAYLAYPLWVYQGLGSTWLYPPGMGALTRAYYLSGAAAYTSVFLTHGRPLAQTGLFCSDPMCTESLEPFSDWKTWRHGSYNLIINCDKKFVLAPEMPHLSLENRMLLIGESALHFFFSRSWPDDRFDDIVHIAQVETRWLWFLLTFFIIGLAWQKKRFRDMVVILCLGTAILYILCDSVVMEGRYRKPWEGITVAAFIFLFNAPVRKDSLNLSDK